MNNPKSMVLSIQTSPTTKTLIILAFTPCLFLPLKVLGWVSLIAVAGVSFYFAKRNINERRRQQDIAGERPSARLDCE